MSRTALIPQSRAKLIALRCKVYGVAFERGHPCSGVFRDRAARASRRIKHQTSHLPKHLKGSFDVVHSLERFLIHLREFLSCPSDPVQDCRGRFNPYDQQSRVLLFAFFSVEGLDPVLCSSDPAGFLSYVGADSPTTRSLHGIGENGCSYADCPGAKGGKPFRNSAPCAIGKLKALTKEGPADQSANEEKYGKGRREFPRRDVHRSPWAGRHFPLIRHAASPRQAAAGILP